MLLKNQIKIKIIIPGKLSGMQNLQSYYWLKQGKDCQ